MSKEQKVRVSVADLKVPLNFFFTADIYDFKMTVGIVFLSPRLLLFFPLSSLFPLPRFFMTNSPHSSTRFPLSALKFLEFFTWRFVLGFIYFFFDVAFLRHVCSHVNFLKFPRNLTFIPSFSCLFFATLLLRFSLIVRHSNPFRVFNISFHNPSASPLFSIVFSTQVDIGGDSCPLTIQQSTFESKRVIQKLRTFLKFEKKNKNIRKDKQVRCVLSNCSIFVQTLLFTVILLSLNTS